MAETYFKGWEGAKMAYKDGASYVPIACITSRSESNATNTSEKVNVCTEGKTVTTATGVTRTVSLSGEVVGTGSLEALRALQKSLAEQIFRVYRGTGETGVKYFKGTITSLSAEYPAGENEDATFSMDVAINGNYQDTDVFV